MQTDRANSIVSSARETYTQYVETLVAMQKNVTLWMCTLSFVLSVLSLVVIVIGEYSPRMMAAILVISGTLLLNLAFMATVRPSLRALRFGTLKTLTTVYTSTLITDEGERSRLLRTIHRRASREPRLFGYFPSPFEITTPGPSPPTIRDTDDVVAVNLETPGTS